MENNTEKPIEENPLSIDNLPEDLQKYIKSLRQEAADNRVKLKEFETKTAEQIAKEQELRQQELEQAKQNEMELEAELLKKSEFQTLYEQNKQKLKELEQIKTKYDSIQAEIEKERLELIKRLPNNKRDLYKDLDIKVIKDVLETLESAKLDTSAGVETNVGVNGEVDYSKMNPDQLQAYITASETNKNNYWNYVIKGNK